jgi:low temperature requirement protein LtrA
LIDAEFHEDLASVLGSPNRSRHSIMAAGPIPSNDMRGIVVPDREEDFSADPVELFFDLVFVFAFSRLVYHLVHHPDWAGFGEFALLFVMIWLPWTQFTWSANAVPGNTRPVRLLFLVATVASVPMAGSVTTALDNGAPAFAISLSVILAMALFTMIVGLEDHPGVRTSALRYSIPNWIAIVLMIAGSFLDHDARIVAWIAALTVVVIGTIRAGSSEWLVRPGHFAERHGLIFIVALGEVIVAVGTPVVNELEGGSGLPGRTVVVLVVAGTFACLLWWGFFDRPSPALEHGHSHTDTDVERGRFARDVYTYIHMPLVCGVILSAAAIEEIALHPSDVVPTAFRWMLFGGLALYLLSVAAAVARAFKAIAIERIAATAFLALIIAMARDMDGLVLLIVVDLVLLVMLVVEHLRVEVQHRTVPITRAES